MDPRELQPAALFLLTIHIYFQWFSKSGAENQTINPTSNRWRSLPPEQPPKVIQPIKPLCLGQRATNVPSVDESHNVGLTVRFSCFSSSAFNPQQLEVSEDKDRVETSFFSSSFNTNCSGEPRWRRLFLRPNTTVSYFLMRPPSVRVEGVIDQLSCSLYGGLKLPT